ncbi:hypothetical protein D3C80_2225400 [compost metagenome]
MVQHPVNPVACSPADQKTAGSLEKRPPQFSLTPVIEYYSHKNHGNNGKIFAVSLK